MPSFASPAHFRLPVFLPRIALTMFAVVGLGVVTACATRDPQSNLVALTTQLRGANEVPPNTSPASGQVDAVFNRETNLLRWKASFTGLTSGATMAHFHGPAAIGANAGVALGWVSPIRSPLEGSATLTPAQAADLLAGRWYANIHTVTNPAGELRGQMIVRN